MRLQAPLRGNKGGSRRARPRTPPAASLPAPELRSLAKSTEKKKPNFFFKLWFAQTPFFKSFTLLLFPNVVSPADFSYGVPRHCSGRRQLRAHVPRSAGGRQPRRSRGRVPVLQRRAARRNSQLDLRVSCVGTVEEEKKKYPHFSCRKKIVWRNRKPGGAAGTRGGRKRRAFEWVVSPQCSSGREFSLQGSGHEKDPERTTKSLKIF